MKNALDTTIIAEDLKYASRCSAVARRALLGTLARIESNTFDASLACFATKDAILTVEKQEPTPRNLRVLRTLDRVLADLS